ncbi:hypothetical protein BABINDRAFT_13164 [Babjeviella inositovora NRRL Y-12698]|uniref:Mitochondrial inner membrane i-AAA protease complex subunit MGR1 n=1 Tax=Babjeviella inositovora NRRL Y-12698 TaxID=984486 RepID=A0A1E3QS19_9ASCO|nr:uncharacterized protein BABINDRAFT_13164 [Babjeviella inositovora NRRL Y-12698]ODQ80294.1 hypothetical protein BABINDRAFT_13164 [Babjeviella inositovora NRRL Y-12698]
MGVILPGSESPADRTSKGKTRFYVRPSFGLTLFGPFVPASDCLPGLYGLTAFQLVSALGMFYAGRRIRFRQGFRFKLLKYATYATGTYLVFQSGLEIARLSLPHDPYFDDARRARLEAEARGERPSWWFGPLNWKPIPYKQYSAEMDRWITNAETSNGIGEHLEAVQASRNHTFTKMYAGIRELNKKKAAELLATDEYRNVTEETKSTRVKNLNLNNTYVRANIELGKVEINNEADFLLVWGQLEPWENFALETDISLRFIPQRTIHRPEDIVFLDPAPPVDEESEFVDSQYPEDSE